MPARLEDKGAVYLPATLLDLIRQVRRHGIDVILICLLLSHGQVHLVEASRPVQPFQRLRGNVTADLLRKNERKAGYIVHPASHAQLA